MTTHANPNNVTGEAKRGQVGFIVHSPEFGLDDASSFEVGRDGLGGSDCVQRNRSIVNNVVVLVDMTRGCRHCRRDLGRLLRRGLDRHAVAEQRHTTHDSDAAARGCSRDAIHKPELQQRIEYGHQTTKGVLSAHTTRSRTTQPRDIEWEKLSRKA